MSWAVMEDVREGARALMVSHRKITPVRSRCLMFMFEDMVRDLGDGDIVVPQSNASLHPLHARAKSVLYRHAEAAAHLISPNPGRAPRRYDLMFFGVQSAKQLLHALPMVQWCKNARMSACFIEELWENLIPQLKTELEIFKHFDVIFVGCLGSVEPLAKLTGKKCIHLPPAVDMKVFSPFPNPPERAIEFYAMGRRDPELHEAFLKRMEETGQFYLFDTAGNAPMENHVDHRLHFAGLIQRTKFFSTTVAKFNIGAHTGGQEEVGFRYYEGSSAGAVCLGSIPNSPAYQRYMGWEDAVIEIEPTAQGFIEAVNALNGQPERMERIHRRNVAHALLRNDHVYRWETVLQTFGLPFTESMKKRRAELWALAKEVDSEATGVDEQTATAKSVAAV